MLDKGVIRLLGRMESVRFHHATQNDTQLKTYLLHISEFSIYYFWALAGDG
jgi:hypothetical protein